MSSSWNMKQGPNFAPAYLVSGTPYVTGSGTGTENLSSTTKQFDFPYVSIALTFLLLISIVPEFPHAPPGPPMATFAVTAASSEMLAEPEVATPPCPPPPPIV